MPRSRSMKRPSKQRKSKKSRKSSKSKSKAVPSKNISLKNPNQPLIGYCVVCKAKGNMNNCSFFRNPNGSVRVAGICQKCGTKMNTFMGADKFN